MGRAHPYIKVKPLRNLHLLVLAVLLIVVHYACTVPEYRYYVKPPPREVETGLASWYGSDFHGRPTSSGEIYNMYHLTAAHKTLPLGTHVRVIDLENGKSVEMRINDRGPFVEGRIIDLSYAGAKALDMVDRGIARVRVEVIKKAKHHAIPYTLQVGSFREKENATALKRELNREYEDVYIVTAMLPDKYFRVRLGYFTSKQAAERVARRLVDGGYTVFTTRRD
ncbi:MAG: septal ring lytic transglycosylase RlpA family protein [Pseudomonadota bacterium]